MTGDEARRSLNEGLAEVAAARLRLVALDLALVSSLLDVIDVAVRCDSAAMVPHLTDSIRTLLTGVNTGLEKAKPRRVGGC